MRKVQLLFAGAVVLSGCGDGTGPGTNGVARIGEPVAIAAANRSTLTVEGGEAGGEFVLIPFFADSFYVNPPNADGGRTDSTQRKLGLTFTSTGTGPVSGPPLPALSAEGGGALFSRSAGTAGVAEPRRDERFHLALRQRERRAVGVRMAAVTAGAGGARLSVSALEAPVPNVGDLVSYNTNARSACSSPDIRTGRVQAVTQRAIVVADTANPTGGFTAADYASFGAQFDTLVYRVDTDNFGLPGDVDANQRSIIFFTRAVNELTEPRSESYVGGFFFGRDLFPRTAGNGFEACPASNFAEIFYMLVPDPTGVVNGNQRPADFVRSVTTGVLAHEFQHLINLSKRFETGASFDEDVWLNEGLSHVAEELLFYRVSGAQPRTNIKLAQIVSGGAYSSVFNSYQLANFNRLNRYYRNPELNSPYADNDSLATRGATWQMLRYLIDRKGGDQAVTLRSLVNTRASGLRNLQNVFGANGMVLARDYTVAVYADDAGILASGTPAQQYDQPSWDFRGIFRSCSASSSQCPLTTRALTGSAVSATLAGGGATYLRFSVAPNATATINTSIVAANTTPTLSQLPSTLQMTLLRTK